MGEGLKHPSVTMGGDYRAKFSSKSGNKKKKKKDKNRDLEKRN